jgi:hypothetical protein
MMPGYWMASFDTPDDVLSMDGGKAKRAGECRRDGAVQNTVCEIRSLNPSVYE